MENMENIVVANEAAEAATEIATGATTGQKVAGAALGLITIYGAYKLVRKGIDLGKSAVNGLKDRRAAKKAATQAAEVTETPDSVDETK